MRLILVLVAFSIPISGVFNSIAICVLFLYSLFEFYNDKRKFILNEKKWFVIYFIVILIGLINTSEFVNATSVLERNLSFIILPLSFTFIDNNLVIKHRAYALLSFVLSIFLIVLSTQVIVLINIYRDGGELLLFLTDFIRDKFIDNGIIPFHAPFMGSFIVFSIIIVFYNFKNGWIKTTLILYFLFGLYEIGGLTSTIVIFILSFLYVIIYFSDIQKKYRLILIIGLAIALITAIVVLPNSTTWSNKSHLLTRTYWIIKKGDPARINNWNSVLHLTNKDYAFGVGTGDVTKAMQEVRDKESWAFIYKANMHNQYLENFVRNGVLGFFSLAMIIFILLRSSILSKNNILLCFVIIVSFSFLTESFLERQWGVTFFVFFGLLLYNKGSFFLNDGPLSYH